MAGSEWYQLEVHHSKNKIKLFSSVVSCQRNMILRRPIISPFDPAHEIMALFILRQLILQTCMGSHLVGLDVWCLIGPFVCFHTSCVRTAKALARLRGCAGSPEPSLVAYVIITIISWASSFAPFWKHSSNYFPWKPDSLLKNCWQQGRQLFQCFDPIWNSKMNIQNNPKLLDQLQVSTINHLLRFSDYKWI